MTTRPRPLSPHLQVYRFWYLMAVSILHRITGVALTVGQLLLTLWLLSLAIGPKTYGTVTALLATPLGFLVLAGFTFAFWYHFSTGIRHLVFDTGRCLERREIGRTVPLVLAAAIGLTALSVWAMLKFGGAA